MNRRSVLVVSLLACMLLVLQCRSQVTFSRDWNAGKRSLMATTDCTPHAHQSAALCQMLLNEIKHLTACEVRLLSHKAKEGPEQIFRSPPAVDD